MREFENELIFPPELRLNGKLHLPDSIPILTVRNTVLFPNAMSPLTIGRESSVRLIQEVDSKQNRYLGVITQRDPTVNEPQPADLFSVGTLAIAAKPFRVQESTVILMVHGLVRFRVKEYVNAHSYLRARVELLDDVMPAQDAAKTEALRLSIETLFQKIVNLSPGLSPELVMIALNFENLSSMGDFIASVVPIHSVAVKQELLETLDVSKRLEKLHSELAREVAVLELKSKIQSEVQDQVGKTQREFYLREQLKAIQKELGEEENASQEVEDLRSSIEKSQLPDEARNEALRELKRLSRMHPSSAEYTVSRTYLDWLVSLPWNRMVRSEINIQHARDILDRDHYGLEKIKDRILEYLAVIKLRPEGKAPILCFVGPPGVGKTSLGKSVAEALGRKFVRLSLGGIRDEAEIRGHRRTYVGALPGQIIQSIRRAGERNPVFMLDEVDKIGTDFRGDPASALLEVLDPEQNFSFRDHYLDTPFDLSRVLFITTANIVDTIPPALLDRMETIELHGYTEEEKLNIARKYLIPRQANEAGVVLGEHLQVSEDAIRRLIREYTREAGLRNLEREIATICRKRARQLVEGKPQLAVVEAENLGGLMGAPRFMANEQIEERTAVPGVAVGL
jgi:ATP-dependent Lon protease